MDNKAIRIKGLRLALEAIANPDSGDIVLGDVARMALLVDDKLAPATELSDDV